MAENTTKKYLDITGLTTYDTKIKSVITSKIANEVGNLENLSTSAKTNIVSAINEVKDSVSSAGAIAVETSPTSTGMLKSYIIKQNGTTVATIDVPKDMVVQSGEIVTNPTGQTEGTYLKLTIANDAENPVYINVADLVDVYTADTSTDGTKQIKVAISSDNVISATLATGSVNTTEIKDSAVTTVKITDKNVTTAKIADKAVTAAKIADGAITTTQLNSGVITSLGLADTALQASDIGAVTTAEIENLFTENNS